MSYPSSLLFGAKILNKIKHWIHERAGAEVVDDNNKVESDSNHLLDIYHTHIAIGMCIDNGQLRYVEVRNARHWGHIYQDHNVGNNLMKKYQ